MNNIEGAGRLIRKDFDLSDEELPITFELSELKSKLTHVVQHLIDRDMSRLLQSLYRIDVAEARVKQILSETEPDLIASQIAGTIIDRQLQKIETRKKYST